MWVTLRSCIQFRLHPCETEPGRPAASQLVTMSLFWSVALPPVHVLNMLSFACFELCTWILVFAEVSRCSLGMRVAYAEGLPQVHFHSRIISAAETHLGAADSSVLLCWASGGSWSEVVENHAALNILVRASGACVGFSVAPVVGAASRVDQEPPALTVAKHVRFPSFLPAILYMPFICCKCLFTCL